MFKYRNVTFVAFHRSDLANRIAGLIADYEASETQLSIFEYETALIVILYDRKGNISIIYEAIDYKRMQHETEESNVTGYYCLGKHAARMHGAHEALYHNRLRATAEHNVSIWTGHRRMHPLSDAYVSAWIAGYIDNLPAE